MQPVSLMYDYGNLIFIRELYSFKTGIAFEENFRNGKKICSNISPQILDANIYLINGGNFNKSTL